jgi:hypothetical protein
MLSKPKPVSSALSDEDLCVVCMDAIRTYCYVPCCHLACCSSCAGANSECPLCRESVRALVRCDATSSLDTKPLLRKVLQAGGLLRRLEEVLTTPTSRGGNVMGKVDAVICIVELAKLLFVKAIHGDLDGTMFTAPPELLKAWTVAMSMSETYTELCLLLGVAPLGNASVGSDAEEEMRRARRTWRAILELFPVWASTEAFRLWRPLRPMALDDDEDLACAHPFMTVHVKFVGRTDALAVSVATDGNVGTLQRAITCTAKDVDGSDHMIVYRGVAITSEPHVELLLHGISNGATVHAFKRLATVFRSARHKLIV